MIPTVLLIGALVGRAWVVPIGGLAWACLLLVTGTIDFAGIPGAALLGSANAAIGMALRQSAGVVVRTIDTRLA